MNIKVRFPPSPTGYFHIGSARTALFNYLFAKQNKGKIVLRIEDTDKERSKPEYEEDIIRSISWLGIDWDEGPYRQSERGDVYKKYLKKLLDEGKAYRCFCTKEELEKEREEQLKRGEAPKYSGKCFQTKREGEDFVIRFRCPQEGKISFQDTIRGEVSFDGEGIGDFIIGKSDFSALYNFVVVVDDHEMEISHIIRGEDHISNTPRQILLQQALGFKTPHYAHLPLILGPDRSKLSKRHAAVSVTDYKAEGYLPEAMLNFIAFLGWNPGGEKEIYSLEEMIDEFNIEKCKKGGAIFDEKKLDSINGYYIRQKEDKELAKLCIPYLLHSGLISVESEEEQFIPAYGGQEVNFSLYTKQGKLTIEKLAEIISLYKERMKRLSEVSELIDYFFELKDYDKDLLRWKSMSNEEVCSSLERGESAVLKIKEWSKEKIEETLLEEAGSDRGSLLWPFRVALSGKKASAGPFEIALVLGKEETLKRLKTAKNKLL